VLAFTDDDCVAPPDWLATFAACFAQEPGVGIVAGDLIPPPARWLQISTCPETYTIECIYRPAEEGFQGPPGFYWTGGNYAVRRSTLALVGPFDTYFGPGTTFPVSDDTDFALRAEELGVVMWTTPRSVIYHTYGRRYGLANVLRHHRAYARGEGSLIAKLVLWKHRLAEEWHSGTHIGRSITYFLKRPSARRLLNLYKTYYRKQSFDQYLAGYEVNADRLSVPKSHVDHAANTHLHRTAIAT
jgi:GT2 family glycosyltransferase